MSASGVFTRGAADFVGPVHYRFDEARDRATFEGYMAHVLDVYARTGIVRPVRVQVRKRGAVLCGRVLEASPGDWFKVDSYLGQLWFAGENVRLCGGNGCSCEGEATQATGSPRACAGAPGACAVPLGNTGTTTVEGAR